MKSNKEKKKRIALAIVAFLLLVALLVGATYAYFQSQSGTDTTKDVTVQTETADSLVFETSGVYITANYVNFAEGTGNMSSTGTARAILKSDGNTTYTYNVSFQILNNEFVYTTEDKKAEVILKVIDPLGNEVTKINGLNYVTSGGISGFDVTTSKGIITISDSYEISVNGTKTDEWSISLNFVNLATDQEANTGKGFNGEIVMSRNGEVTLANYLRFLYTEDGVNNLYYHDGIGNYTNASYEKKNTYSFTYSGSDNEVNNYVCFGSDAEVCPEDNLYRIIELRSYNKDSIHNSLVKLISADYASPNMIVGTSGAPQSPTTYKGNRTNLSLVEWSDDVTQYYWYNSSLKNNLETFYNSFPGQWRDMISYNINGGNEYMYDEISSYNAQEMFNNDGWFYGGNYIATMQMSDYLYAFSPIYWDKTIASITYSGAFNYNWLYLGENEWLSLGFYDNYNADIPKAFMINNNGEIVLSPMTTQASIRPTFYLNSNVLYKSGTGAKTDPFRLS